MNAAIKHLDQPRTDVAIRAMIMKCRDNGTLPHFAHVVGIAGGSATLLQMLESSPEPMKMVDRVMIGMHLNL